MINACLIVSVLALFPLSASASQPACEPLAVEQAWHQCAVCHTVVPGDTSKLGPNLNGVIGRPAGSQPGYVFSPALAQTKFIWSRARLDAFLRAPQLQVPGNRMPFGGIADAQTRADILCTLVKAKQ